MIGQWNPLSHPPEKGDYRGFLSSDHLFDDAETKKTIGIPIEIHAFLRPARIFGIGLVGFASINSEDSFASVALNTQWGKLK